MLSVVQVSHSHLPTTMTAAPAAPSQGRRGKQSHVVCLEALQREIIAEETNGGTGSLDDHTVNLTDLCTKCAVKHTYRFFEKTSETTVSNDPSDDSTPCCAQQATGKQQTHPT